MMPVGATFLSLRFRPLMESRPQRIQRIIWQRRCFDSDTETKAVCCRCPGLSHETLFATLYAVTRQAPGGIVQAIAAIENALLDIEGKALGVPCYELFGGKIREHLPLYWSHCGSYPMTRPRQKCSASRAVSLEDLTALGAGYANQDLPLSATCIASTASTLCIAVASREGQIHLALRIKRRHSLAICKDK